MNEQNNQVVKRTNGFAIAGLILSIIGGIILAVVGLILSIVGASKAKEYNSGMGLSIAGIVVAILKIIFTILIIVLFAAVIKSDEFAESYCKELGNDYETICTKNDDGTYECNAIFRTVTCDFSDKEKVEDKKEDKPIEEDKKEEEPEKEETPVEPAKEETTSKELTKKEFITMYEKYLTDNELIKKDNLKSFVVNKVTESGYIKNKPNDIFYVVDVTFECKDGGYDCVYVEQYAEIPTEKQITQSFNIIYHKDNGTLEGTGVYMVGPDEWVKIDKELK